MIKRIQLELTKGGAWLMVVATAAVIGGATSAVVLAAIPSSGGTISACYNKSNGALSVIDAESGATCSANQNPLSWSSSGGGSGSSATVHDANGQVLGMLTGSSSANYTAGNVEVYNSSLNRMISINGDIPGQLFNNSSVFFTSNDCSGQGFVDSNQANTDPTSKLSLFVMTHNPGTRYEVIGDNAQVTNIAYNSIFSETSYDGGSCSTNTPGSRTVYPLTDVTLPFITPLALPLHF